MTESEVSAVLAKRYDIRHLNRSQADSPLWWATEKGSPNKPALFVQFNQGYVVGVRKKWFDETQPNTAAQVLRAQYEAMQDLVAQRTTSCNIITTSGASEHLGYQTFETEMRCGDVQVETIREMQNRRDVWVEVNEILIPPPR